ncbi:MAG: recombinase family protein [Ruminococcus sp.]|nr:recombinase family protein [Ruminococcus sp.]
MNAVIYARYSSDKQTEQSIEGQLRDCMAFAEAENLTVIDTYIDRAMSGKTDLRPAFQKMISDSASRKFECIIVWKLDRFARNRYDSAVYKAKLRKNGVRVLSAQEHITSSPEGIIMEGLLEAMNEYYSAELSVKVKRGMRENVLKSKTTGGNIPLGFRVGADKQLEIDPAGAQIVRKIFDMYNSGSTYTEIINTLNAMGLRTSKGNPFNKNSIARVLVNRKYIGEYTVQGIDAVSECPAIIERSVFMNAQRQLESASKKRKKRENHICLLTGKLRCGTCGGMMFGTAGTAKSGKVYHYYKCRSGCERPAVQEELNALVMQVIAEYLSEDQIQRIAEMAYNLYQEESADDTDLTMLRNQLKEVNRKIQNAVNAVMNGMASTALQTALAQLEDEKSQLEVEVAKAEIGHPEFNQEHFHYFLKRFADAEIDEDLAVQMVDTLVNCVVLYPDRIAILINVTNNENTPPLEVITSKVECSRIVLNGDPYGN